MNIPDMQKLSLGDIIRCDFSNSSPVYWEGNYQKNLYPGSHPAMFVAVHKGAIGGYFALVCPMSKQLDYAKLDRYLVTIVKGIDIENSRLIENMHTVNCRLLISVSISQILCNKTQGIIKKSPLKNIAEIIVSHLDAINNHINEN